MALREVKGKFYELLLRGVHADGNRLGEFQGAHLIEADAIIDTATGEVKQFTPRPARPIERAAVAGYLGEQFVAFEEGHRKLAAEARAVAAKAVALEEQLAAVTAERDQALAQAAAYKARLDAKAVPA